MATALFAGSCNATAPGDDGPGPFSAAHSVVSVSAATVASGISVSITLQLRDANGEALTTGGHTVEFSLGGGTSQGTLGSTADAGNGSYSTTFTGTLTGTPRTIGASVNGTAVTTPLPTITTTPGPASPAQSVLQTSAPTVASGMAITLVFRARDAAGNSLTAGGASVMLTLGSGTSGGTLGATTDNNNGTYSTPYTGTTVGTARTIQASLNGSAITTTLPTVLTVPGAASPSQSVVEASAATVQTGATATLTLRARDAAGNALTSGGATVLFTLGAGSSGGTFGVVTDNGNGTYTGSFTGTTIGTARTIGATVNGASVTSPLPTITTIAGPASAAQSVVELSASSVASGSVATVTLRTRDAAGNALTTGGATVAFALATGTSGGTLGATSDNGDGTYSASFTATTVGTPRTITATLNGAAVTTTLPAITTLPGPLSVVQSVVEVGATSLQSGAATNVTLRGRDAASNALTTGGATVVFTLGTGTSAGTFASVTDVGNGTYTAVFTATTTGTARAIGATVNGTGITSTLPTITVSPGPVSLAQSLVETSATSILTGATATLTLRARDAASNALTTGGLTVVFTKGAGTSDGTISATTDNGNGTYSATFTGTTVGSARTIGATIGGNAVTGTLASITVNTPPGGGISPATSTVTLNASTLASGSTLTITLQGRDAMGALITSGGATVAFSLSGAGTSTGSIGAVTDNGDGTYTAQLTGAVAGTARAVAATINGIAVATLPPTFTVTPGAISSLTSIASVVSGTIASGSSTTITLQGRDAAGNLVTSGGAAVAFSLSGAGTSTGTIGAVTDNANGTYSALLTGGVAGSARAISATINAQAVTTTQPTFVVTPGPISTATSVVTVASGSVASGSSTTITLRARDAAGNELATGGATLMFSLAGAGTSTGTIGAVTDNANGTYTASFTGVVAGTARTIAATIGGVAVTTTQPTITVTTGGISSAASTISLSAATVVSGASITATLQTRDAAGNPLATGGATVAFALGTTGTSTGTFGSVTDNSNGTYSATLTGALAGTARSVSATVGGTTIGTTLPTFTVTPGAPSTATSLISAATAELAVGSSTTLTLSARDAAGNVVTTGSGTIGFGLGSGTSGGTIGAVSNPGGGGTYQATFTANAAGTPRSITATINGNAVSTASPTILVYQTGLTLSTAGVLATATAGQVGAPLFVAIFANGGQTAAGMTASVAYTTPGIAACQSSNWLGAASFDLLTAAPVSIVSFTPNATSLGVYTCTANVTISSTTPGYASQVFTVTLSVARGALAQTAVTMVTMGNAGNNSLQDLTPYAKVLITNGGRGNITGVHAQVISADGEGENPPDPWLKNTDLAWLRPLADTNARTLPDTLRVRTVVSPFSADAVIRVTGTGMSPLDIPVTVLFNITPELVTNPRGVVLHGFAGGSSVSRSVVAFDQNHTVAEFFVGFSRNTSIPLASWLNATVVAAPAPPSTPDSALVTVTANPFALLADSIYTDTVRLEGECSNPVDNCFDAPRTFKMPVRLIVERGIVVPGATALFAPAGSTTVTRDVSVSNGGITTISGLSANVGGAAWLSASFVGGTAAPTTLRLTANPTGFPRGSVLNTTVTVSASTPASVPSKSFPVTFRIY